MNSCRNQKCPSHHENKTVPDFGFIHGSALEHWSRLRRELWRGCRLSQKAHRCHRSSRQGVLGSINPYCHGVLSEFESRWIELDKTEDDFWIASFVFWAGFHPLYHCPFEIGLCSGKGGHGRLGRVETGLLSRTLPIGIKGADRSTKARRAVPLYFFESRLHRVPAELLLQLHLPRNKDHSPLFAAPTAPSPL